MCQNCNIVKDAVVEGSENFVLLGFLYMLSNMSVWASCILAPLICVAGFRPAVSHHNHWTLQQAVNSLVVYKILHMDASRPILCFTFV